MQQLTSLRRRWNPRGQWVQLGVLSATVVTPLLSRWNELRAAERARALRDEAEDRLKSLKGARALLPLTRQMTERAERAERSRRLSSTLWIAGASLGVAVAGVSAYIFVRRQLDFDTNEPLVILPAPSRNGHDKKQALETLNGSRSATAAPAQAAPSGAQAPATAPAADSAVATLADEALGDEAASATATATEDAPMGVEDPAQAKFIGNVRTLVFHEADAENLPAEENRVYFASEEEAHLAGYRRDRDEVSGDAEVGE